MFLIIISIIIVVMFLLQVVRTLKHMGMTMGEIYAMVGLRPRDEL